MQILWGIITYVCAFLSMRSVALTSDGSTLMGLVKTYVNLLVLRNRTAQEVVLL